MSKTLPPPAPDFLSPNADREPEPGHDRWFRDEVEATLAREKAGRLKYRSLDDVAEDFGFNAR